ncbi:MAG: DUF4129 domain-containing protein [Nitrososphaerota archaeon]
MEIDLFYSPVFWLALNIVVAIGILMLRRSLNSAARSVSDEVVEGPLWRLERALSRNVTREEQREYMKHCIDIFLQILTERGVESIHPSSTVREVLRALNRSESMELLELYEAVRFGRLRLTDEELNKFKRMLRTLARSVIH